MRSILLACAAAMIATSAFAQAPARQSCADMSFRIYFTHGSAALDATAREMIEVAQRNAAECRYAAVNVAVDASSPLARQRGQAILAAMHGRTWNAARLEPRATMRDVSLGAGPDFAEVTVAGHALAPAQALPSDPNVGV